MLEKILDELRQPVGVLLDDLGEFESLVPGASSAPETSASE